MSDADRPRRVFESSNSSRTICQSFFNLSETGERYSFVQSFSYHMESFRKIASEERREKIIMKIFEMCTQYDTSSLLHDPKIASDIYSTFSAFHNERAHSIKFWIIAIAVTLLIDPQSSNDTPKTSLVWFQLLLNVMNLCRAPSADHRQAMTRGFGASPSESVTQAPIVSSPSGKPSFHSKRKYRSPLKKDVVVETASHSIASATTLQFVSDKFSDSDNVAEKDTPPVKRGFHGRRKFQSPSKASTGPAVEGSSSVKNAVSDVAEMGVNKRKYPELDSPTASPAAILGTDPSISTTATLSGHSALVWINIHSLLEDAGVGPLKDFDPFVTFRPSKASVLCMFALHRALQLIIRKSVYSENSGGAQTDVVMCAPLNGSSTSETASDEEGKKSLHSHLVHKLRTCGLLASLCIDVVRITKRISESNHIAIWQNHPIWFCAQRSKHEVSASEIEAAVLSNYSDTIVNHSDRSAVWTMLNLIETSCFRNSSNPVYLSEKSLSELASDGGAPCSDFVDEKTKDSSPEIFASYLVRLLRTLTPIVLNMMQSYQRLREISEEDRSRKDDSNGQSRPKPDGSQQSPHDLLSDVYLLFAPDRSPVHRTLCTRARVVAESGKLKVGITRSESHPSISGGSPISSSIGSSGGGVEQTKLDSLLGLHDIWLCCLKVAVNLSHQSAEAKLALADLGIMTDLVLALQVFSAWRHVQINQGKGTEVHLSDEEDSPGMGGLLDVTLLDKYVFDGLVFIMSLLTNMVEVTTSLIPESTPEEEFLYHRQIRSTTRILQQLLQNDTSTQMDSISVSSLASSMTPSEEVFDAVGVIDVPGVLVDMLGLESQAFLNEISTTETNTTEVQQLHSPEEVSDKVTVPPDRRRAEKRNTVPVDELVLATHMSLLIKIISDSASHVLRSKYCNDIGTSSPKFLERCANIKKILPQESWWLPIRTLKAYISLQNETHTLIQENTLPVVAAIQSMEKDMGSMIKPRNL